MNEEGLIGFTNKTRPMELFSGWIDPHFMPHGHCYLWQPDVLWTNVLGDGLTAMSYFIIPFFLQTFLRRRANVEYAKVVIAFALFIFICGLAHTLAIVSVWTPLYRVEGIIKLLTAVASIGTVLLIYQAFPKLLRLPTQRQLVLANQRLRQEIEQHQHTLKNLQETSTDLEYFMYATTHDLRAPLTNIRALTDVLKEEADEIPAAQKSLGQIIQLLQRDSQRLDNLISELLAFSRASHQDLSFKAVSMQGIVEEALNRQLSQYPDRTVEIELPPLPTVQGDRTALVLVWDNLISNALKYAKPSGKVRLSFSAQPEKFHWRYSLTDNGIGFDSAKQQHRLFQLFQRLNPQATQSGVGMGLAVVARIIQKHGGKVGVDSQPNQGATFYFTLPKLLGSVATPSEVVISEKQSSAS